MIEPNKQNTLLRPWVAWALVWIGKEPRQALFEAGTWRLNACEVPTVCTPRFAFVLLILVMVFVVQFIIEAGHQEER